MFEKILIFLSCLFGFCGTPDAPPEQKTVTMPLSEYIQKLESKEILVTKDGSIMFLGRSTASGNYLASNFAQNHHDWNQASRFLDDVLKETPDNENLLSRAMILAMGSGNHDKAVSLAQKLVQDGVEVQKSLPYMFLISEAFHSKNYDQAAEYIASMPDGSISDFITPLLKSWADAAKGEGNTDTLIRNTIHIYHAFLINDYLGNHENFEALAQISLGADGLSVQDLERVADVYTLLEDWDSALNLYKKAATSWPENQRLAEKAKLLDSGEHTVFFTSVKSPEEGVAYAFLDMAQLLFNEYSDDSARIFSQMALYLNPKLKEADLLLGYIASRNNRYEDALKHYSKILPEDERYAEAQRLSANLLEEMGRIDGAVNVLEGLVEHYDDVEALIQIGSIYRRADDFKNAVKAYNRAEKAMGGTVTPEYWHLHYVRGMSYERIGEWKDAENDLKAALSFRPNHPLVLNYLGYAWADQGEHLEEALSMIRKAASIEPEDGYITDSLGWVLYRMGKYKEAIPHLEKAVELLPYDSVINDHLGDAYWRVGRKLEARFQWERAINHAEKEDMVSTLSAKIDHGLDAHAEIRPEIKEALVHSKNEESPVQP